MIEKLKEVMIKKGWNVGCISNIDKLSNSQVKKIIDYIRTNGDINSKTFLFDDKWLCEIENPYYKNELDVTVKHKNYYN